MILNCGVGEDSWESLGLQGDPTSPSSRKSVLNIHWKDWCWSWNSNTLATWCKELTHWKRSDAGKDWRQEEKGKTEDEMVGWHHWPVDMSWWWTGRPGVLQSMGLQRVRHYWATELNINYLCTSRIPILIMACACSGHCVTLRNSESWRQWIERCVYVCVYMCIYIYTHTHTYILWEKIHGSYIFHLFKYMYMYP